jgi:hypothetical protein
LKYDTLLNYLTKEKIVWFNSWGSKLDKNDFSIASIDTLMLNNWIKIQIDSSFLVLHNDLLQYSTSRRFVLDMYSYRGNLKLNSGKIYANFDIDTEVKIIDLNLNRNLLLFHTGSMEVFDDGLWLDDDNVVLLGSIFEPSNDCNQCYRPFILFFNIKTSILNKFTTTNKYPLNTIFFPKRYTNICID